MRSLPIPKYALHLITGIMTAVMLQGCVKETEEPIRPEDGQLQVRFEVAMPADLRQGPQTRMSGEEEATVSTIDVFHFVKNTTDPDTYASYKGVSHDPAQGTFTAGPPSWINAKLSTQPGKDSRLVFVVNARKTNNYGYAAGMTLKDFTDALVFDHSGDWNSVGATPTPLPMYGITGIVEIKKDMNPELTAAGGKPFGLMRMHAKFNIRLKEPLDEGVFTLHSVCVFNQKEKGFIAYDPAKLNTTDPDKHFVTSFHIPANPGNVYEPAEPYFTAGTDPSDTENYGRIINKQYVFEADNASQTDKLKKTALVVGGWYNGVEEIPANLSYYRVDVPDNVTGGNILRNRLYDVEIQNVKGSGSGTAKEAFEGGASIQAKIDVWNLADQNVASDGQYRLQVEKTSAALRSTATSSASISVNTTHPNGIVIEGGADSWFTVTPTDNGSDWTVTVESSTQNNDRDFRSGSFYVRAGNMKIKIAVTQNWLEKVVNVTEPPFFNPGGGTTTFSVESYITEHFPDGTEEKVDAPWEAKFSDGWNNFDQNLPPDWFTLPLQGEGGEIKSYELSLVSQPRSSNSPEDNTLMSSTPKGTADDPFDLSTLGGLRSATTANCYIIDAPGHYKIPLVYGNALKNGVDNPSAYRSTAPAAANILSEFVRHDDQPITGPYIYDQFIPASAALLWDDMPNIINTKISDDGKFLIFETSPELVQGNTVLAVKDAGVTILWSWHIWATPLVDIQNPATDEMNNFDGVSNYMMKYNLGWCTVQTVRFGTADRSKYVQIIQKDVDEPASKYFRVLQKYDTRTFWGNAPYWQWGRKDPIPPSYGINAAGQYTNNALKTLSNGEYNITLNRPATLGEAIQTPNAYYYQSSGNWSTSGDYINLWNADNTRTDVNGAQTVKTVYDPCPVGFKLPKSDVWTALTNTGENLARAQTTPGYSNYRDPLSFPPFNIYLTAWKTGPTAYYPALGFRYPTLAGDYGKGAYYWSAGINEYYRGYNLGTIYSPPLSINGYWNYTTSPKDATATYTGMQIRPMAE